MEKIIIIDGKEVKFKATGGIAYRYKAQFGREYIADAMKLEEFTKSAKEKSGVTTYDYTKLSLDLLYNILWTLAKTADDSIPSPMQWLDSFDTFPVMDIYSQVKDILNANLKIDTKNVKAAVKQQTTIFQCQRRNLSPVSFLEVLLSPILTNSAMEC